MSRPRHYVGRFAPSPTGPLHEGSIVAALASWLDARAHQGLWQLRIEDIDPPREQAGASDSIIQTLAQLGLIPDGEVQFQSKHTHRFRTALDQLHADAAVYPCACTRSEIAESLRQSGHPPMRHESLPYPGTCRHGMADGRSARAWRLRVAPGDITFEDRWMGRQSQNVAMQAGDFVLLRADGLWAYQLAVVVDDAQEGITDVVRGADLLDSTPRQIALARAMGCPEPRYLHVPTVSAADGQKLSKQNGAAAVDSHDPVPVLSQALRHLGFEAPAESSLERWLPQATQAWAHRFGPISPF